MTESSDPLRNTLDTLEVDPRAQADRPYLISMLRRLGYTERQIEEYLQARGMGAEEEPAPAAVAKAVEALGREYRLVIPAADSQFVLAPADAYATRRADSPFEDLERLEFASEGEQDLEFEPVEDEVEFTAIDDTALEPSALAAEEEAAEWAEAEPDAEPLQEAATDGDELSEVGATEPETRKARKEREAREAREAKDWAKRETRELAERGARERGEVAETWATTQEADPGSDDIESAGGASPVTAPRKRVRMQRIRARSSDEASSKVAGEGRKVLKSIPVDVVERWGTPGEDLK